MISVGQTKVKSRGQKKRTTYFPRREERVKSSMLPPGVTEGAVKSGACLVTSTLMVMLLEWYVSFKSSIKFRLSNLTSGT